MISKLISGDFKINFDHLSWQYLHVFITFIKIKLFTIKEIKRINIYNKIIKIINKINK